MGFISIGSSEFDCPIFGQKLITSIISTYYFKKITMLCKWNGALPIRMLLICFSFQESIETDLTTVILSKGVEIDYEFTLQKRCALLMLDDVLSIRDTWRLQRRRKPWRQWHSMTMTRHSLYHWGFLAEQSTQMLFPGSARSSASMNRSRE